MQKQVVVGRLRFHPVYLVKYWWKPVELGVAPFGSERGMPSAYSELEAVNHEPREQVIVEEGW